MRRLGTFLLLATLVLVTAPMARASDDRHPPHQYTAPAATDAQGRSLYERLGGEPGLYNLASDFFDRLQADGDMRGLFVGVDMDRLKHHVVDFLAGLTGGPKHYTGRDMHSAHARMKISPEEWDRTMTDLHQTLDKYRVPDREQAELTTLISGMKEQIIQSDNDDDRSGL